MLEARESRPGGRSQAAIASSTAIKFSDFSLPDKIDILADLDAVTEHLKGRFVVQVNIEGDHWRTNVYRNAAAAERAVDRAKARGQRAHVTLCQMLPVGVVVGLGGVR